MKKIPLLILSACLAATTSLLAVDKYEVTGPVVELTDTKIVVVKGKEKGERHEFVRNADTKVTGDLKVGSRVTVRYTMTASAVEVKDDTKAKK